MAKIYTKEQFEPFAKDVFELICSTEHYGKLDLCDKPDFKSEDNSVGIEFTLIGDESYFHAVGTYNEEAYDKMDSRKIEKYEKKNKVLRLANRQTGFLYKCMEFRRCYFLD